MAVYGKLQLQNFKRKLNLKEKKTKLSWSESEESE